MGQLLGLLTGTDALNAALKANGLPASTGVQMRGVNDGTLPPPPPPPNITVTPEPSLTDEPFNLILAVGGGAGLGLLAVLCVMVCAFKRWALAKIPSKEERAEKKELAAQEKLKRANVAAEKAKEKAAKKAHKKAVQKADQDKKDKEKREKKEAALSAPCKAEVVDTVNGELAFASETDSKEGGEEAQRSAADAGVSEVDVPEHLRGLKILFQKPEDVKKNEMKVKRMQAREKAKKEKEIERMDDVDKELEIGRAHV